MLYIYIYITRVTWSYFFQFCTKSFVGIPNMGVTNKNVTYGEKGKN